MAQDRIELPQGTLDLLILKTVALGPQHGWAISERIQQISRDVLQVQQGSLILGPRTVWSAGAGLRLRGGRLTITEERSSMN